MSVVLQYKYLYVNKYAMYRAQTRAADYRAQSTLDKRAYPEEPLALERSEEEADEGLDHGGAAGGVVHAVQGVGRGAVPREVVGLPQQPQSQQP